MPVALVLSGGGSKGDFELGAIRFLYDNGLKPDILCGTSVGAINAAKLAEGNDPANPGQGLTGLELIWESLRTSDDMYVDGPWMKSISRDTQDVFHGRTPLSSLEPQDFLADVEFVLGGAIQILQDEAAILKFPALYDASPIRAKIDALIDVAKVKAWATVGRKLRIAVVGLNTGRLRYVTEAGALIERDATPVLAIGQDPCAAQVDSAQGALTDLHTAQADLLAASTGEKPAAVRAVQNARRELSLAEAALTACRTNPPASKPGSPIVVDIREAVKGSAALPPAFTPVFFGDDYYTDGGVRQLLPMSAAILAGATEVYAVLAGPAEVQRNANIQWFMADTANRAIDLLGAEISFRDQQSNVGLVHLIYPDFAVHDTTVVDPGLIQINRDYGYMRASDVIANVDRASRRWALPTLIAQLRVSIWREENQQFGQPDPTALYPPPGPPNPGLQSEIVAKKGQLKSLFDERSAAGGPMPNNIRVWQDHREKHPWDALTTDAASFVSQQVPAVLTSGTQAAVSIVMMNSGTTTWTTAAGYKLGSQSPQDNTTWGLGRVELTSDTPPGATTKFTFKITAPLGAGNQISQWRMLREGVNWFGQPSDAATIAVGANPECLALANQIKDLQAQINSDAAELAGLDHNSPGWRKEATALEDDIHKLTAQMQQVKSTMSAKGCS